jgi:hypothetical protein
LRFGKPQRFGLIPKITVQTKGKLHSQNMPEVPFRGFRGFKRGFRGV